MAWSFLVIVLVLQTVRLLHKEGDRYDAVLIDEVFGIARRFLSMLPTSSAGAGSFAEVLSWSTLHQMFDRIVIDVYLNLYLPSHVSVSRSAHNLQLERTLNSLEV